MKNLITCLVVCVMSGTALADTWTVDDDGKADFDNIQAAVDAASDGDEIIVMPGIYTGEGNHVVDMLGKEISLHSSEGAEVTIIDGQGKRRGIYCANNETLKTTIRGFTITNGNGWDGGGMYNYESSPRVISCTFENNTAQPDSYGGGMMNYNSSPELYECTFTGNTAEFGGGMYNYDNSSPTLTDCTFQNNTATYGGGGMLNSDSNPTLTDCTFENNTAAISDGGGMYNYDGNPTLTDCTFENNTAANGGGGMYAYFSSPTLENCTFTSNSAYDGGGIWLGGGSITSCTFTNNHATWGGGASCRNASSVTFCTFTDNIGLELGGGLICHGAEVVVNECNIRGNQSGNGGGIFTNHVTGPSISNSIVCGNVDSQISGAYVDLEGNTIAEFCPEDLGTCCTNDICLNSEEEDDCIHFGGQWLGKKTTCADNPCQTSCLGDVTGDGQVDVSDILVIISVWGACP